MLERLSQLKPPAQPYDRDVAPGVRRETGSAADGAPGWSGGRSDGQTSLRPHGEPVGTADGQGASPFGGRGVGSPAGQGAGLSGENPGHSGEHDPTAPIAPAQRNRLRSEREFLSVVAANPAMIASQAETLASVEWRSELHRQTAFALLDAAAQPGVATMADVLSFVSTTVPQAASLLTASTVGGSAPAADLLAFLGNELACGDLEMQIVQLRDELRTGSQLSPEEQSLYFQTTVALQQQLNALRSSQGFRNA